MCQGNKEKGESVKVWFSGVSRGFGRKKSGKGTVRVRIVVDRKVKSRLNLGVLARG